MMLLTRDYLQATPWDALIARINDLYRTELEPFTTRLGSFESEGGTRTRITIVPKQVDSSTNTAPPIVHTEYTYDRLDLSTFFVGPALKQLSGLTLPTDTFKVLDAISELNDIVFTLNDFTHVQYDTYNEVLTLEANPKSLRFVGQVQFELVNTTKKLLANLGDKLEFPLANTWPLGTDGELIAGQYMVTGFDFTDEREFIKRLDKTAIWPSGRKLAAILEDVTGRPWVCSTEPSEWNIAYDVYQSEARFNVLYNGIVLPRYTPRTDIQRVLVLQLGDLSTNVNGYLLIHYN